MAVIHFFNLFASISSRALKCVSQNYQSPHKQKQYFFTFYLGQGMEIGCIGTWTLLLYLLSQRSFRCLLPVVSGGAITHHQIVFRCTFIVGTCHMRLVLIWKFRRNEPPHVKTNKVTVRPAKTQTSLDIRPVWSESSLCAQWVAKDPSFLHADSEDSDQTGWMSRLIWVFAGRTLTLLVL